MDQTKLGEHRNTLEHQFIKESEPHTQALFLHIPQGHASAPPVGIEMAALHDTSAEKGECIGVESSSSEEEDIFSVEASI